MEQMKTESFKHPVENQDDKLDDQDTSCLRLKCGHCYHTECMVMAFRQHQGCPLCREDNPVINIDDVVLDNNILNQLRQELEIELPLNENQMNIINEVDTKIQFLRTSNYHVQKARQNQNIILRQYNEFCEYLKKERSDAIKEALLKFRRKHRSSFNKKLAELRSWMANTKEIEINFLLQLSDMTPEKVNAYMEYMGSYSYSPEHLPRNLLNEKEPIHLRFWFH